jgi:hypothetical protein
VTHLVVNEAVLSTIPIFALSLLQWYRMLPKGSFKSQSLLTPAAACGRCMKLNNAYGHGSYFGT